MRSWKTFKELKQNDSSSAPITVSQEVIDAVKERSEELYATFGKVRNPYLQEEVSFNAKGMEHLKFKKKNRARSIADQLMRLKLLEHAPNVLKRSGTVQGMKRSKSFESIRTNQRTETVLMDVIYYEFVAIVEERVRVRIIVKKVTGVPAYFWSIIPFWKTCDIRDKRKMHYGNPAED